MFHCRFDADNPNPAENTQEMHQIPFLFKHLDLFSTGPTVSGALQRFVVHNASRFYSMNQLEASPSRAGREKAKLMVLRCQQMSSASLWVTKDGVIASRVWDRPRQAQQVVAGRQVNTTGCMFPPREAACWTGLISKLRWWRSVPRASSVAKKTICAVNY